MFARTSFLLITVSLGASFGVLSPVSAQEKNHASWWITTYGLLDESLEPLAARAETIFERLAAAADKRANRLPRLALLDAEGQPFAMALPDGTVLLTREALRICYRGVSNEIGDARLAFVIGHELSHLGNDDFWHAAAFDAMKQHVGNGGVARGALELLDVSLQDVTKRELQADGYGMLYMTIAGYDPRVLVRKKSFFDAWAEELDALGVRTVGKHPPPGQRAALIESQLEAITDELQFFHFGLRLVQLGRYQDGLLLLERFRDRFPSREVLNNVGVAHYQLAARYLGNCDGRLVVRFLLPTMLDPTTKAIQLRSAGRSSPCFGAERFRLHFHEAERNLKEASGMDPSYVSARLNLLSLYVLAERGAEALLAAEEAKELAPDDPRALSCAAVALHLYGEQSGLEMADHVIGQLLEIRRNHPESKEAIYNLASMLAARRRVNAAEDAYRAYLALEHLGPHADAAREYLGDPRGTTGDTSLVEQRRAALKSLPRAPVSLGSTLADELPEPSPHVESKRFILGDFTGRFLEFDGGKALVIDRTVELIEQELRDEDVAERLLAALGSPEWTAPTVNGSLEFYGGVVVVNRLGRPESVLFVSDDLWLDGRRPR